MDKFNEIDEFDDLNDEMEVVKVLDEMGNELEFYVIDAIKHKGINYLLVIESEFIEDDECEAVIIKELEDSDGEESVFCIIEDDVEFNEVAKLFEENTDDYEIEL